MRGLQHQEAKQLFYGMMGSVALLGVTLALGMCFSDSWRVLSLVGTSIILGAQPAAVASIALGFHPFMGAVMSILANLIPVPVLMLAFQEIIEHWRWVRNRVKRIQRWSLKYERYGVALVSVLSPFIGSYVCIAIGDGLEWNPVTTLAATFSTTILSVFLITYGEQWVIGLFAR